jgi:hypothetical protein
VFRPESAKDTGAALIIAPGGANQFLSWDIEGENIAKWCNDIGVTGIILKYPVPRSKDNPQAAFHDGQRAVSLSRSRAAEWGINPKRIGMIGFSAGAGVTTYVLLNSDKRSYEPVDDADKVSARLDYGVLIYGGGLGAKGKADEKPANITKEKIPPYFFLRCLQRRLRGGGLGPEFPHAQKGGRARGITYLCRRRPRLRHPAAKQPADRRLVQSAGSLDASSAALGGAEMRRHLVLARAHALRSSF